MGFMKQSFKADTIEPPEFAFHFLHFTDLNHYKSLAFCSEDSLHLESAVGLNSIWSVMMTMNRLSE